MFFVIHNGGSPCADSGRSSWDQPVWLVIRKSAERLELYIGWNSYLGSEAVVTYRIGKEEPETKEWSLSSDSQASFYTGDTVDVISRMLKADQVVARCTPYNESPITAVFDIRGLRKELEKYKEDFASVYEAADAEMKAKEAATEAAVPGNGESVADGAATAK